MTYLAKTPDGLLPCPFCGGEAHIKEVVSACDKLYTVGCSDSECTGYETWLLKPTVDEAVAAWNRRSERTCRDTDYDTGSITCSECGEITRNTLFWAEVDGGWTVKGHRPRFCSNCGARVVEE